MFNIDCRIERRSFSDKESEQFTHYCRVVVQDFLPHLVNCFNVLFPPQHINDLASRCPYAINQTLPTLTLSSQDEQQFQVASRKGVQLRLEFNLNKLVEPLKLMLPDLFINDLYIADSLSQHAPVLHRSVSGDGDVPTEDGNDVINDDIIAHNSVQNSSVTNGANGDVITDNGKEEVSNDKVESKNGDSSLPTDNVDNESIA